MRQFGFVLAVAVAVWAIYVVVETARAQNLWPF